MNDSQNNSYSSPTSVLQGIRGQTGDYGNIGEPGLKVRSGSLKSGLYSKRFNEMSHTYTHLLRVKKESKARKEWEDSGAKW